MKIPANLTANVAQWWPHIAYDVVTNEAPGLVDIFDNGQPGPPLHDRQLHRLRRAERAASARQMDLSWRLGRAAHSARYARAVRENHGRQAGPIFCTAWEAAMWTATAVRIC